MNRKRRFPGLYPVVVRDNPGAYLLAVQQGPAGAAEIVDLTPAPVPGQRKVKPRHSLVVRHHEPRSFVSPDP
jgi:hypothetical protein